MQKVIIIRLGEIFLKGKNRNYFEKILIENIKNRLKGIGLKYQFSRNRYIISDFSQNDEDLIKIKLLKIYGINSISIAYKIKTDMDSILKNSLSFVKNNGSFKVIANRADKNFQVTSPNLCKEVGAYILSNTSNLSVDIHNPDFTINIDIREDGYTYLFSDRIVGACGMPVGTAGKGLLLLSGGIDSPVAGCLISKRGMSLDALHFHSYPYTSDMAKQKVEKLASIMQDYCGNITLYNASFTKIQEAIHKNCNPNYMITIMRRIMMRIAEQVSKKINANCIVNGESLGQVASQTIQSIVVTNSVVTQTPILRPLIAMDKQEILDISVKIGTYKTSILPYEDCCTVFLPKSPVTKPTLKTCEIEESKILNLNELIEECLNNLEVVRVN